MSEVFIPEKINGDWAGKDYISVSQVDKNDLQIVFDNADAAYRLFKSQVPLDVNTGKIMPNVFLEDSTRTRLSFDAAFQGTGGSVLTIDNANFSSMNKGENLIHTVKTIERYSRGGVFVIRHKQVGSAALAASKLEMPVINAGDGIGEHPTQAKLDIYSLLRDFEGEIDDKVITIVGDLKHGRTTHSLLMLLCEYMPRKVNLVTPEDFQMPLEYLQYAQSKGLNINVTSDLDSVLSETDALYMVRLQRERIEEEKGSLKDAINIKVGRIRNAGSPTQQEHIDDEMLRNMQELFDALEQGSMKEKALSQVALYSLLKSLPDVKILGKSKQFDDNLYILDEQKLSQMKPTAKVKHPMPVGGVITEEAEEDPRVTIFDQVEDGAMVRAALTTLITGDSLIDYEQKLISKTKLYKELMAVIENAEKNGTTSENNTAITMAKFMTAGFKPYEITE